MEVGGFELAEPKRQRKSEKGKEGKWRTGKRGRLKNLERSRKW